MHHYNTCCDCKDLKPTAWRMTDEGRPDTNTAIRCCDDCADTRGRRGETLDLIKGDFEAAMRGCSAALRVRP